MTLSDDWQKQLQEIAQEVGFAEATIEQVAKDAGVNLDEDEAEEETPDPVPASLVINDEEADEEEEPGLICHRCGDGLDIVVRRTLTLDIATERNNDKVVVYGDGTSRRPYYITVFENDGEETESDDILWCTHCMIEIPAIYDGRPVEINVD